jgi:hypothetical protein
MRKNPLNKGIIMENAAGIGTVTSEMVEARARELAAINGRPSSEPSEADYQQAKRELTGEAETDPQEESSESVPDSDGWNPVPGSTGRQTADSLGEDEDGRGTERECTDVRRRRHRSGARSNASGIPGGRAERRTRGIKVNNLAQDRECTIVVYWRPIRNSCLILQSTRNTEPPLLLLFKK